MTSITLRHADHNHERLSAVDAQGASNRIERGMELLQKAQGEVA